MGFIQEMKIFWDTWEVQVYTLLGITFQISLIAFGSERKRLVTPWIKAFVWIGFLGSIWTAKAATGNLGGNAVYFENYALIKRFWPPFFLILLGSPDTITAYAIEDNSLWLRLLLDFFIDVGRAIYVFILARNNFPLLPMNKRDSCRLTSNKLMYLAALMYIVGIIKYGERAYVRHKSSFENFRDSLLSKPDPFPDIIKIKMPQKYQEIMIDNQPEPSAGQPRNSETSRTEIVGGSGTRDFKEEMSAEESRKSDTERGEILGESKDKVFEQEMVTTELAKSDIEQGRLAETLVIEQEGLGEESRKNDTERGEILQESEDKVFELESLTEELAKSDIEQGMSAENKVIEQEGLAESAKRDIERGVLEESDLLFEAFFWFKRFAHLFAGLILDKDEGHLSITIFKRMKAKDAFNLVAVELGIMYDVLYTKATIVYSRIGILLRCISVVLSISVLIVFFRIVDLDDYRKCNYTQSTYPQGDQDQTRRDQEYTVDMIITYVLLLTNAYVECFGVILIFDSDWATIIGLTKFNNRTIPSVRCSAKSKRWSEAMGQFNLISSCLKEVSVSRIGFRKLYSINDSLKMSQYRTSENVSGELLDIIFKLLEKKTERVDHDFANMQRRRSILAERGDYVLQDQGYNEFILDVDFDQSLLLWHIATDLCYSYDFDGLEGSSDAEEGARVAEEASSAEGTNNAQRVLKNGKISKCLSDYMLYLLVTCPYMMPQGIGELRFADTFAFVKNVFKSREDLKSKSKKQACDILLEVDESTVKSMGKGLAGKHLYSELTKGIELAKKLKELDTKADWGREKKWRMVSEVWVEMLAYAANNCEWIEHGYRLSRGGELLTHVCLLMAHLGLSEQYRKNGRKINDWLVNYECVKTENSV